MMYNYQLLQLASQILPTEARNYAKVHGWEPVTAAKGRIWVFRHSVQKLRQLVIPIDQEDDAYSEAIVEVLQRIADDEKRSPIAVASDLLMPNSDIVRFRVAGDDILAGNLSLEDGACLIEGAKRAILSSACSVINKTTHHPRMSRSEAAEMLKACKFGQTEYGSFVAKIACPLNAVETNASLLDATMPFVRHATKLLSSACHQLVESIENDAVSALIENNSANPIITSNLCDALLRMQGGREKSSLGIDITWASNPNVPIPDVPRGVVFKAEYFRTVDEIQRALRPKKESDSSQTLLGTVETLNGPVGEDGRRSGEVILALLLEDEEVVRARAVLGPDEYARAVQAHNKGRTYIMVKGVLQRGNRISSLQQVESFDLVGQSPPSE
ncbi:hypothetical protein GCAAIG_05630 [Candidatus Electronema halotolerans]